MVDGANSYSGNRCRAKQDWQQYQKKCQTMNCCNNSSFFISFFKLILILIIKLHMKSQPLVQEDKKCQQIQSPDMINIAQHQALLTIKDTKQQAKAPTSKLQHIYSNLYETNKYFSPFRHSTQEQIIDEIQSLGEQILFFEQESIIKKHRKQLERLIQKHHRSVQNDQRKQWKIINHGTSVSKPKQIHHHQKQKIQIPKQQIKKHVQLPTKRISQTPRPPKPKSKQKMDQIKKNRTQIKKSTPLTSTVKKQVKKPQPTIIKPFTFDQNVEVNYNKFINKNMDKMIKDLKNEKQLMQKKVKNENIQIKSRNNEEQFQEKKLTFNENEKKNKNRHLKTHQSNLMSSRQKLNQTGSSLYAHWQAQQQRKEHKITAYRQQRVRKQMQQVTFQPKSYTTKYKSANQTLNSPSTLTNFYNRLKKTNDTKMTKQLKRLHQAMQEYPFQPRLNISTRHVDSIVKQIWSSTSKSKEKEQRQEMVVKRFKADRSIQKINRMRTLNHSTYVEQDNSFAGNSLEISVQDTHELSFLLR